MIRAARATLSVGYEPEALAHDRILLELQAHRRVVLGDETGNAAKKWIDGDSMYGVTRKVAAITAGDLYKSLCQDSHGDPRPIERLFNRSTGTFEIGPTSTLVTRACLLMYASFARDQAAIIAEVRAGRRVIVGRRAAPSTPCLRDKRESPDTRYG